jgi:thiol peroxidase
MVQITRRGDVLHTHGDVPAAGSDCPDFTLTAADLSEFSLSDLAGRTVVLNIFPSIDTPTCATSVRTFNEQLASHEGVEVINVSADLPFAQARFCGAEGLDRVSNASTFRNPDFGKSFGVEIIDSGMRGLLARAIVVVRDGKVLHSELVPEIAQQPNYEAALNAATA